MQDALDIQTAHVETLKLPKAYLQLGHTFKMQAVSLCMSTSAWDGREGGKLHGGE